MAKRKQFMWCGEIVPQTIMDKKLTIEDFNNDKSTDELIRVLNNTLKWHKYLWYARDGIGQCVIRIVHQVSSRPSYIMLDNTDTDTLNDVLRFRYLTQFGSECGMKYDIKVTYCDDKIKIARVDPNAKPRTRSKYTTYILFDTIDWCLKNKINPSAFQLKENNKGGFDVYLGNLCGYSSENKSKEETMYDCLSESLDNKTDRPKFTVAEYKRHFSICKPKELEGYLEYFENFRNRDPKEVKKTMARIRCASKGLAVWKTWSEYYEDQQDENRRYKEFMKQRSEEVSWIDANRKNKFRSNIN